MGRRPLRRYWCRQLMHRFFADTSGYREGILTLLVGAAVSLSLMTLLSVRMRPLAAIVAETQAENTIHQVLEEAVLRDLVQMGVSYGNLVSIERDSTGAITALTTDVVELNRLRGVILERILEEINGVDVSEIHIPLSSLLDLDVLWAKGPSLKLHGMRVGTVSAEFESEFSQAGINQTLHRIWLDIGVPLTLILPGDEVEVDVESRLCVAETIIVGSVPDTYVGRIL